MALNFKPGSVVRLPDGRFNCEIWIEQLGAWVPTTCAADDVSLDQRGLYIRLAELSPGEVQVEPEPDPADLLALERAAMVCSPLQGSLALGEAVCDQLDALAADPATPWAMRRTIQRAGVWERTSEAMTELGWLLGYTDEQMDALFRLAMTIRV